MKAAITGLFLSVLLVVDSNAGLFDDIKNSMVVLETESGRHCGIRVTFDNEPYVLTSQDAFTGNIISMKNLSGKTMQPLSFEVPEEAEGLLRIKTDQSPEKAIPFSDSQGEAETYRIDMKMGIISELAVQIESTGQLKIPDAGEVKIQFLDDIVGSPVFSKDGRLLGIAGINGYDSKNCAWTWDDDATKSLNGRRNELQSPGRVRKWKKVDQIQLFKQNSMICEARAFIFPFSAVADTWCGNSYGPIELTPEQPDKLRNWIETQNLMVKVIPVNQIKISNAGEKSKVSMKNVMSSQLRDQNRALGKRLCDYLPTYQKNLSSKTINWESAYMKRKAEDISAIYRVLYEGLRKEAEDRGKLNPPL